jgi:23S rRNA (guanosine2251-2'-O)-methyltransferase
MGAEPGSDAVVVAGPNAVEALLRHGRTRVRRVLHAGPPSPARDRVIELARAAGCAVETVAPAVLDRHAGELRHQGLVALAAPAPLAEWSALIDGRDALLVAFDQVTDPHNLGAILRSCEALGGTGALVTRDRCARPGPTVSRTSAGASEILPVAMETNLARALDAARDAGLQVVGADLDGEAPWCIDLTLPTVLVIGAEGTGLRRLTRERCDRIATIPLGGRTESLNASAAAAALLYEAIRQRRAQKTQKSA